jgi:hypothetical protein
MKITKEYILQELQNILEDENGNDDMFNDIERLINKIEKDFK